MGASYKNNNSKHNEIILLMYVHTKTEQIDLRLLLTYLRTTILSSINNETSNAICELIIRRKKSALVSRFKSTSNNNKLKNIL